MLAYTLQIRFYICCYSFFCKLCKYLLREFICIKYIPKILGFVSYASSTSQKEINCCESLNRQVYYKNFNYVRFDI